MHTAWDGLSQVAQVESEGCVQIASNCSSHQPQPLPPTNYAENIRQHFYIFLSFTIST
jgi:hypothetical protein